MTKNDDGGLLDIINAYESFLLENKKLISKISPSLKNDIDKTNKSAKTQYNSNINSKEDSTNIKVFKHLKDVFEENEKLKKNNVKPDKNLAISYDYYHIEIPLKIKNIQGIYQWCLDENKILNTKHSLEKVSIKYIDFLNETITNFNQSYEHFNEILDNIKNNKEELKTLRSSKKYLTQISIPNLNLRTKHEDDNFEELIVQGEGYGIEYRALAEIQESNGIINKDYINDGDTLIEKDAYAKRIKEILDYLITQANIDLKPKEYDSLLNYILANYDESSIVKPYDSKIFTTEKFIKDQQRNNQQFKNSKLEDLVKDLKKQRKNILTVTRKNIILYIYSFFTIISLSYRPNTIINPNIKCLSYAKKSNNDTDFYLYLFTCTIRLLSIEIPENHILYEYFIPFREIKTKERLYESLRSVFENLANKEIFRHAFLKSEQRIIERNSLPLSKTWNS